MLSRLKPIVEQSPTLSGLNYLKGQLLYRLGAQRHLSGATHRELTIDESVRYIQDVIADYLLYGGVNDEFFINKRILEVGPGDNLGVALSLLAKGAEKVTSIDAFTPACNEARNYQVYTRLFQTCANNDQERVKTLLNQLRSTSTGLVSDRLEYRYGLAVENLFEHISGEFDLIISRAVLEHVSCLETVWRAMAKLLCQDGRMWHKIDLRHHGLFAQFHPLYFLTIHPALWRCISAPDPTLNRERLPKYKALSENTFSNYRIFFTHALDLPEFVPHKEALQPGYDYGAREIELIREIRARLQPPFCELSDEDLLVTGIFIACDTKLPV